MSENRESATSGIPDGHAAAKLTDVVAVNLTRVRETVADVCAREGRNADRVEILAVTKGHPMDAIFAAVSCGLLDVGENRVQEALAKHPSLPAGARMHMIGQLQTNKVNKAVGVFDSIQSMDRLDLLERVARRAGSLQLVQDIWIEVHLAGASARGGCSLEEAPELWGRAVEEPSLQPIGFMAMAGVGDPESQARGRFSQLRTVAQRLKRRDGTDPALSMGMSGDYAWAVAEGSTQIRLGSVLFGPRPQA